VFGKPERLSDHLPIMADFDTRESPSPGR
jgi:hypothetical protein